MLFDLTTAKGTLVIAVLSATKVVKDLICSISSSNLSIFVHPDKMSVLSKSNLYMLLGSSRRPVQSFKFIKRIFLRCPILEETEDKLGQP